MIDWNSFATSPYVSSARAVALTISSWFIPPTERAYINAIVSGNNVFISRSRPLERMYGRSANPPKPARKPIPPNVSPVTISINGDRMTSTAVETLSGRGIPMTGPAPSSCKMKKPMSVPNSHSASPVSRPTPTARERYISTLLDIRAWLSFRSMSSTKSLFSSNSRW
ncbi:MAG: hypothetical protein J07HX64_01568 [halophilic archaeon J07HX64]|nr:MAG: hypothetical protein J07HX64_01568 [halophilic archaeon J07HX64]